ncbi:MAG: hypothetical protein OJF52_004235 [Nitrospira sp.]|jgi:hypothetical protein|nr:MAG: hypothetical protein OJF52_004235 [Nitrospira sp.]
MSQHELIDRLQRACQRGESIRKMAKMEGLRVDTVRRITSTPRFQRDLTMQLVNTALTRATASPQMDRITGRALTGLLRLVKSGASVSLSMEDLASLGAFSQQQQALAVRRG